jgi:hypothetical protein
MASVLLVGILVTRRIPVEEMSGHLATVLDGDFRELRLYAASSLLHNIPSPWLMPAGEHDRASPNVLDLVDGEMWQQPLPHDTDCCICLYNDTDRFAVSDNDKCHHTMCVDCCAPWLGTPHFTVVAYPDELLPVGKCPKCNHIGLWVDANTREAVMPTDTAGVPIPITEGAEPPYRLYGWHRRCQSNAKLFRNPLWRPEQFRAMAHSLGKLNNPAWHYAGTEFSLEVLADYFDSNFARFHFTCDHCHAVITHLFAVSASACQCLCYLRCVFGFLFDRTHLTYTKRAICPIHDDNSRFTLPNIPVRRTVYADVFLKEKYPTGAIPDTGEL